MSALLTLASLRYHANVCESRNPLAYFLCAVHRQAAPQPRQKKDRHASISSDSSSNSASSCNSTDAGKNCELPELCLESMLPLGYWDGLYYALVAEIRQLHADLQEKYGWAIENGVEPLHYKGTDGTTNSPVTPIELASMLESAWVYLMDNRLVASLDDAVRMRKVRENATKKHSSADIIAGRVDDDDTHPPVIQGLVDVNGMTTDDIVEMLWTTHAPEVDQACSEDFQDESMLTAYRAEIHAQNVEQIRALGTDLPTSGRCRCRGKCICSLRCSIHASHCTCAPPLQVYHKIPNTQTNGNSVPNPFIKPEMAKQANFSGDKVPLVEELNFGVHVDRAVKAAQMPHNAAMDKSKMPSRYKNRQRANTNNSELAYVPESKSGRGKSKDAYPLAFYGDSPGRYPKIRKDSAVTHNYGEGIAAPGNFNRVMPRKPVPAPLTPTQSYVAPDSGYGVVTPPANKRFPTNAFAVARARQAYHEHAKFHAAVQKSYGEVTESFPVASSNPRTAVNSDPFMDRVGSPDPADEYVGLIDRHPSSFEEAQDDHPKFPTLARSVTTTPPRAPKIDKISASTTHLPTLKALAGDTSKPMPPLPPLPDFIAPRPATVQRYVSAGGNLPLAQRAEIVGPAFQSTGFATPVSISSGAGISKAELDAKMSDPDWVKTHFGPNAMNRLSLSPPSKLRASEEGTAIKGSQYTSRQTSMRTSSEQQNPRQRTSSGVSRLKRIFSRKNSFD